MKIETLTPEQEAEFPCLRQRYLDIACNGGRIEHDKLEIALADAYAVIGRPAPGLFIFDSPAACMIAINIFEKAVKEKFKLGNNIRNQLTSNIIPSPIDQNPCAHCRRPMDMMRQG